MYNFCAAKSFCSFPSLIVAAAWKLETLWNACDHSQAVSLAVHFGVNPTGRIDDQGKLTTKGSRVNNDYAYSNSFYTGLP
jgi:hypothetical protein